MTSILILVLASTLMTGAGFPAVECVATPEHQIVCLRGAADSTSQPTLYVIDREGSGSGNLDRFGIGSPRQTRVSGPMSWGVHGNCYHYVTHTSFGGRLVSVINHSFESRAAYEMVTRVGRPAFEERRRVNEHSEEHGRRLWVIERMISDLEWSGIQYENTNLFFDLAYTATNHVTVIAVRNGQLRWWTWNKPEETDWVDRGTMETRVEGAFRIVQAGDDLYLVDGRGWVFSSPDRGGRLLGTIAGWGQPREGETLFLLEEQRAGKIAVVKVAEGRTTVLEALVESEAREDFMTTIDDEDLDRAIIRMAAALHEEEQGGK